MKILLLADALDVGGAETHIYELSRSLLLSGHRVRIFSGGGRTAEALGRLGVEITKSECVSELPRKFFSALSQLLSLLREYKPNVVHAHTRKSLLLCEAARAIIPFPLVFTAHAKFTEGGLKGLFTRPPLYTLAVSEDIKRHFSSCFGADADRITVIENGIDTERFSPVKKPSGFHVLTVSRLDRDCSLCAELLCALAPRLARLYPDFRLTVVGGGNALPKIKKLAEEANRKIGKAVAVCTGALEDVLPLVRECDVFAGVSRAALEAMSCDKPTVLCGNEGYFGICDNENFDIAARENFCARGYPVPDGEKLFEDIVTLLENPESTRFRLRGKVVEGYRAELMAQKVAQVYRHAFSDFKAKQKYDAVLCGYYGFGNAGDELVKERILSELSPLRIAVVGAKGGGRIWRFDLPKLCRAVRNSSGVILGGGSLLQDSTSRRSLEYYLSVLKTADFFGKNTMLYANGIGPLRSKGAEKSCKKALRHADTVSLRDKDSLALARRLLSNGTLRYLSCDPALSPIFPKQHCNRIAVFIRGEDESEALTAALSESLSATEKLLRGSKIIFSPMSMTRDTRSSRRLAAAMPLEALYKEFDCGDGLTRFISESRLVISSRLHALIIAASSGVPFIALCGDPKLEAFVGECRLPDILSVPLDSHLTEGLTRAIEYAAEHEESLSKHLKEITAELCRLSERDPCEAMRLFSGEPT